MMNGARELMGPKRADTLPYPQIIKGDGLLWLAVILVVCIGFLPIGRLLFAALSDPSSFESIASWSALYALRNTLLTGLGATALALMIGGLAAILCTLTNIRLRGVFSALFTLSMLIAPQIIALGYLEAFQPNAVWWPYFGIYFPPGTPHPLRSLSGIILVLALHHAPLVFLTLRAGLIRLPRELIDAAAIDGASSFKTLRLIVLPLIRSHIVTASILCFIASAGNFGIPAMLGISNNILTLPTLIYRRLSGLGPGMIADMAALSLILVVLAGLGLIAARRVASSQAPLNGESIIRNPLWALNRWRLPCELALFVLIMIALIVPIIALLATALVPTIGVPLLPENVTLVHFQEVFFKQAGTMLALSNSLLFSISAAIICATLALPCAYVFGRLYPQLRSLAEFGSDWPYAMPGIVLAVAFILLFLKPLPLIDLSLYGTGALIVLAYIARFFVLSFKPALAALDSLDKNTEEAASLCGAGRFAMLRFILWPTIAPPLFSGGIMIFLTAFNELTVSALLWGPKTPTLGVAMFGYEETGLPGPAAVLSLTGIAVGVIAVLAIDLLRRYCPAGTIPWR